MTELTDSTDGPKDGNSNFNTYVYVCRLPEGEFQSYEAVINSDDWQSMEAEASESQSEEFSSSSKGLYKELSTIPATSISDAEIVIDAETSSASNTKKQFATVIPLDRVTIIDGDSCSTHNSLSFPAKTQNSASDGLERLEPIVVTVNDDTIVIENEVINPTAQSFVPINSATSNLDSSKIVRPLKRPIPCTITSQSDVGEGLNSAKVTVNNASVVIESDLIKRKKVDIYTEDTYPKWYDVHGNNITKTIVPKKLPEAFDFLPIHGKPTHFSKLEEFLHNKVKEFIGCGINDEDYVNLLKHCSPDHLRTGKELNLVSSVPNQGIFLNEFGSQMGASVNEDSPEADSTELCVVKKYKLRVEKDVKNTYAKKLKYRGIRMIPLTSENNEDTSDSKPEDELVPGQDLVYHIRIYRPFTYNYKEKNIRLRHSVFSRDVVMLGRQSLAELRDRIVCASDLDMRIDISDRIDDPPTTTAKELFPSGFMFINNVFYTDSRAGCAELTARVRRWARAKPALGLFPKHAMHVRLQDINVKLGHPEVYVHQGSCEHLFTFSEIRLLTVNDPLKLTDYPCHTSISQNQTIYCTTCAEFGAKWIVAGCERVPFDPAFFCDTCLRLYLYKDGEKIGNFKAYSYRGNEINMLKPQG